VGGVVLMLGIPVMFEIVKLPNASVLSLYLLLVSASSIISTKALEIGFNSESVTVPSIVICASIKHVIVKYRKTKSNLAVDLILTPLIRFKERTYLERSPISVGEKVQDRMSKCFSQGRINFVIIGKR